MITLAGFWPNMNHHNFNLIDNFIYLLSPETQNLRGVKKTPAESILPGHVLHFQKV
jgi:hypothetical protein